MWFGLFTKPTHHHHIDWNHICSYLHTAILSASGGFILVRNHTSSNVPNWPATSNSSILQFLPWIPKCLRYVRIAYATLIRVDLPNEVLDIIQKLINQIRLFCLSTIFKKAIEKTKSLDDKESWNLSLSEFPGATNLTNSFEEIVVEHLFKCMPETRNPWEPPARRSFRRIRTHFRAYTHSFNSILGCHWN